MENDKYSHQIGIYGWFLNQECKYVGKVSFIERGFSGRYSAYITELRRGDTRPIHHAMRKYGFENFEFRIIEICDGMSSSEIIFRESLWIKHFRSLTTQKGYNLTPYDMDRTGVKHSEETKRKISAALKGRPANHIYTPEIERKRQESRKGYRHSQETIEKIRKANTGTSLPKLYKAVDQFDLQGNYIQTFNSTKEANLSLGLKKNHTTISGVLHGRKKSTHGYIWRFAKENK